MARLVFAVGVAASIEVSARGHHPPGSVEVLRIAASQQARHVRTVYAIS